MNQIPFFRDGNWKFEKQTRNNIYVVQPGDNLYGISKEFGVTVDELAELNGIDAPDLIYPGETIAIDEAAATRKQTEWRHSYQQRMMR